METNFFNLNVDSESNKKLTSLWFSKYLFFSPEEKLIDFLELSNFVNQWS